MDLTTADRACSDSATILFSLSFVTSVSAAQACVNSGARSCPSLVPLLTGAMASITLLIKSEPSAHADTLSSAELKQQQETQAMVDSMTATS